MQSKISARASRRATRSRSSTSVVIGGPICHADDPVDQPASPGANIRPSTRTRQWAPIVSLLRIQAPTRMSSRVDMPGQEIQDSPGEDVVAIPGDHVSCPAHVGELDLREARQKFVSAVLADEVTNL